MGKLAFSYAPLDLSRNEIRLIKLQPLPDDGTVDESRQIECSVEHVSLDAITATTTYEALSYTWGDNAKTESIQLDAATFPVTKNLHEALRALRSASSNATRRLWVDAVCINQEDSEERNAEVLRMRTIYETASRVVVWLGESNHHTDLSFKALEHLSQKHGIRRRKRKGLRQWAEGWLWKPFVGIAVPLVLTAATMAWHRPLLTMVMATYALRLPRGDRTWRTRMLPAVLRTARALCALEFAWVSMKTMWHMSTVWERAKAPIPPVVDALKDVFTRSWFRRMWIIQEVFVSRSAVLMIGNHAMPWDQLHRACLQMKREVMSARRTRSPYLDTLFFRESKIQPQTARDQQMRTAPQYQRDLLSLLVDFQSHHATDPRDKVYALLGLAEDVQQDAGEDERIKPNYELSVEEIYARVAWFIIDKSQDLTIFAACRGTRNFQSLPSWTPDWSFSSFRTVHGSETPFRVTVPDFKHMSVADYSPITGELTVSGFLIGSLYGESPISMELGGSDMANKPLIKAMFTYGLPALIWMARSGIMEKVLEMIAFKYPGAGQYLWQDNLKLKDDLKNMGKHENQPTESEYEDEDSILPGAWGMCGFVEPDEKSTVTVQCFEWVVVDWLDHKDILERMSLNTFAGDARAGDFVCLLIGAKTPVLLRQQEDHFLLVGLAESPRADKLWDECEQKLQSGSIKLLDFNLR